MMQQERGNPTEAAYRPGSLELVIALGSLALIIGIGIGVILNQSIQSSVQSASVNALPATVKPTRLPKPTPRVKPTAAAAAISPRTKPTAAAAAISPRTKPTAQAAKPTSAQNSAVLAPTSVPPTATPAPTPAPAAAPAKRTTYSEYTVKKGDILFNLAKAHGVTVAEILSINTIKNPDSLMVGEVIRIPKK